MNENNLKLITTITPLRISLFGGGTDLKKFYSNHKGQVISSAINKYIYVTVKQHSTLYKEKYRLNYSITEKTNKITSIKNDIIRSTLKYLKIDESVMISTYSDLPANSGLGSSSSFCVGLLNALHNYIGESVSAGQLAEEACKIEIDILENSIGKQDQYIAAFGGINRFIFNKNGKVLIDPINLNNNAIDYIFDNSVLIWSGVQRSASKILEKQNKNTEKNINNLKKLLNNCNKFLKIISSFKSENFLYETGKLLELSWVDKKLLNNDISTLYLDNIHKKVLEHGGLGGKLCGAGGGGFFFELIDQSRIKNLENIFNKKNIIRIKHEPLGSRLLYKN